MALLLFLVLTFSTPLLIQAAAQTTWYPEDVIASAPPGWVNCRTNEDCGDLDNICCSITPALGKRQIDGVMFYPYVHYCLPYKTADAQWCSLNMQYSPEQPHYFGLCPCGPGLQCTPTDELDPSSYPRDRYGKCTPV